MPASDAEGSTRTVSKSTRTADFFQKQTITTAGQKRAAADALMAGLESGGLAKIIDTMEEKTQPEVRGAGNKTPTPPVAIDEVSDLITKEVARQLRGYEGQLVAIQQQLQVPDKDSRQSTRSGAWSRPTTDTSRQFVGSQQRVSPEEQSSFAYSQTFVDCGHHYALRVEDEKFNPASLEARVDQWTLSPATLEEDVVERVIKGEPDRRAVGMSHIVVRNIANAVVRDIVGILECLVDRLLLEKKQDQLRTIVATLMTEDVGCTVAVAAAQLRDKEIGHIMKEVEHLRADMRDRSEELKEKFKVTDELRNLQNEMSKSFSDRCNLIEDNTAEIQDNKVSRDEPQFRTLKGLLKEFEDMKNKVEENVKLISEKDETMKKLAKHIEESYTTKVDLNNLEKSVLSTLEEAQETNRKGMKKLREDSASKDDHEAMRDSHEAIHVSLQGDLQQLRKDHDSGAAELRHSLKNNDLKFVTKNYHEKDVDELSAEMDKTKKDLAREVTNLLAISATNAGLEDVNNSIQSSLRTLNNQIDQNTLAQDRSTSKTRDIEDSVTKMATKEYAYNVASKLAYEAASESDEKEEIAALRVRFDEECGRTRQAVQQQQKIRQEFNSLKDGMEASRHSNENLQVACGELQGSVDKTSSLKEKEFQDLRNVVTSQKHAVGDLQELLNSLRDEFRSHVEFQNSDREKLKQQSTQGYLEQMDQALHLHSKVEKLESSFKLPHIL